MINTVAVILPAHILLGVHRRQSQEFRNRCCLNYRWKTHVHEQHSLSNIALFNTLSIVIIILTIIIIIIFIIIIVPFFTILEHHDNAQLLLFLVVTISYASPFTQKSTLRLIMWWGGGPWTLFPFCLNSLIKIQTNKTFNILLAHNYNHNIGCLNYPFLFKATMSVPV